jgi:hypothetical protein
MPGCSSVAGFYDNGNETLVSINWAIYALVKKLFATQEEMYSTQLGVFILILFLCNCTHDF